jgi:plasmid stabilization system protein ParE
MAYRVAWSPEALEDLEAIAEFIGRDSRFYAQAVVSKVLAAGASIADFPEAGRRVPESDDQAIRERFVYSYRVIYRIESERVLAIAVIHGKRLIETPAERGS